MRISARCDYACKALLELSLHWPKEEPLSIQAMSKKQDIPVKYLLQIMNQLKRMGLVESTRGTQGGYVLARPPRRISLGEVARSMGGPLLAAADGEGAGRRRRGGGDPVINAIWKDAEQAVAKILDETNFEDIAARARKMKSAIVYQI